MVSTCGVRRVVLQGMVVSVDNGQQDLPNAKETPTPILLSMVAMAVAVVRSLTGNHKADRTGGTPMATGPASPFRN